ncbi:MAG: hypothetical protein ACYS76_04930 [Planctomycetota bacterium]|jgi:hypothetical protein
MQSEEHSDAEPRKGRRRRVIALVAAAVAALIVLIAYLVPAFVSSEKGREIIIAKIDDSIGGKTNFATVSMSWWKGLKITDFNFEDEARGTSIKARAVLTKPHYISLLMGSLSFGETRIYEPRVEITLAELPPQATEKTPEVMLAGPLGPRAGLPLNLKRIDLHITDGSAKITDTKAQSVEFSQVNSRVNLRPPGRRTDFDLQMVVVKGDTPAKVSTDGRVTPNKKAGWSLRGTSGDFVVEVNDLDLESLGPVFAIGGVELEAKGRIWSNIKTAVRAGQIQDLSGTIKGRDLDITGEPLKGDRVKTRVLDVNVNLRSEKDWINIDKLQIHSDWLDAQGVGVIPRTLKSLAEFVKPGSVYTLEGSFNCDLAAALSQLPHTLGVREGATVTSGRLTGGVETPVKAGKKYISASGKLAGLAGTVAGRAIALSEPVTAEVEITSAQDHIWFEKLSVLSSFAKIDGRGSTELLKYEARANLAKLQAELGQFITTGGYEMAGELSSKGEVASRRDRIAATGSALVKELRLTSKEGVAAYEPEADIEFSVTVTPNKGLLDVDSANVSASLGHVAVDKSVVPWSDKADRPLKLDVSADNIDLEKIQPFAVLFASFPKEMQLAGIAESKLSVKSENDGYHVSTDATRIEKLKVSSPGKKPFEQNEVSLVADVSVQPVDKTLAVKKLKLTSPQIKIHKLEAGEVSKAGTTRLEGQVDWEYDWAAVTALAGPYLPAGLELEGQVRDTIDFSSEYPTGERSKLPANLTTKGKLAFARAYYKGLTFSATTAEIEIVQGLLTISEFSSTVNNGVFKFAGQADLKQKPALLATLGPIQIAQNVEINDDVSKEFLVYLNPVFADAFDVSGVGNFHCERLAVPLAGGPKEKLQIIGTISVDNARLAASNLLGQLLSVAGLSLREQRIRIHPTRFILWDGFLRYQDMQIDVGDNPLNFKGTIGLDKSLNMTVTLPYTVDGRTVRVGQEDVPDRISLPLRGTTDKPELDLEKALQDQLQRQLERQLKEKVFEGLDELLK